MTDQLLIIFVKNPELGKVKTRLAATVGDQKALEIYLRLIEYTAEITRELPLDRVVFYTEFIDEKDLWEHRRYQKQLQIEGDLGQRMKTAFEWGFNQGYGRICIIGSDCLELTPEIIEHAFHELNTHDVVMGPTEDGGYYLLGMKEMHQVLFNNKEWGQDSVAADTQENLRQLALSHKLLETLNDVDTEEDLERVKW